MVDYINTQRIEDLSVGDNQVPINQKVIKLGEEAGELSQAFLKMDKAKNVSATAGDAVEGVLEEACDVLNVTIDIINALTKDSPELEEYVRTTFERKLDKWENKQIAYNQPAKDYAEEIPVANIEKAKLGTFFTKLKF